jgi:SAM-dependent methyltransferase
MSENDMKTMCPLCMLDARTKRFFSHGETDFRVCSTCGLVFREHLPSKSELALIYAKHYAEANINSGHTEQESGEFALKAYFKFLQDRVIGDKERLLDYGAGTGQLVELFRSAGVASDGLEFSKDARQYCLEQRGFNIFEKSTELSASSYDLVTLIEVVEHLPDLMLDLVAVRNTLRPGGQVFITTPNRLGLRARMEKGHWNEARKKFHLFLFDQNSLERALLGVGFSRVKRIRFSPIQKPGPLYWIYGRVCQLLGLSGTLCVVAQR